jgi:hypothetical protein
MSFFKIYLLGVIVAWIICKIVRTKDKDYSWMGIFVSFAVSLFSWAGAIIASLYFFPERWAKKIEAWFDSSTKSPPTWL